MSSRWRFVFYLWILLFTSITAFWIFKNNLPPFWDEAHYLTGAQMLFQTLNEQGIFSFLAKTTTILGTKAPLITILPIPLYLIFGSSYHVAVTLNIVFALMFFVFFIKLVSLLFDEGTAFISCLVISTMPLFYGLSRYFLVEFGLTAFVVAWIFFAFKTEQLKNKKYLFFVGITSGLGMMMKFHFFLFITGPATILIYEVWRKNKKAIFNLKNLLIFSVPALVITLPWYARNILTVLWKAKRSTDTSLLGSLYYGSSFSASNLYRSALDFINYGMSAYWFVISLTLIILFYFQRKRLKLNSTLLGWFLIPFIIFYLGPNKDYRLMLPLLPVVAIFISRLITILFPKRLLVILVLTMIFPVLVFLNTAVFAAKLINKELAIGPLILADKQIGNYVKASNSQKWPVSETLTYISNDNKNGVRKIVISASENEAYNINTLQYYALLAKLPLEIHTVSYFPKNTNYFEIQAAFDKGDYMIMKTGGVTGPKDLNVFNETLLNNIDSNTWKEMPNEIKLPDGGKITIWKKVS